MGPALARAGFRVLAIDMPCFGGRAATQEGAAAKAAQWRGGSLAGQMLGELASALDWLAADPGTDPRAGRGLRALDGRDARLLARGGGAAARGGGASLLLRRLRAAGGERGARPARALPDGARAAHGRLERRDCRAHRAAAAVRGAGRGRSADAAAEATRRRWRACGRPMRRRGRRGRSGCIGRWASGTRRRRRCGGRDGVPARGAGPTNGQAAAVGVEQVAVDGSEARWTVAPRGSAVWPGKTARRRSQPETNSTSTRTVSVPRAWTRTTSAG